MINSFNKVVFDNIIFPIIFSRIFTNFSKFTPQYIFAFLFLVVIYNQCFRTFWSHLYSFCSLLVMTADISANYISVPSRYGKRLSLKLFQLFRLKTYVLFISEKNIFSNTFFWEYRQSAKNEKTLYFLRCVIVNIIIYLEIIDKTQRKICNIIGHVRASRFQSIFHRRNIVCLCLFYKYFVDNCFDEMCSIPSLNPVSWQTCQLFGRCVTFFAFRMCVCRLLLIS